MQNKCTSKYLDASGLDPSFKEGDKVYLVHKHKTAKHLSHARLYASKALHKRLLEYHRYFRSAIVGSNKDGKLPFFVTVQQGEPGKGFRHIPEGALECWRQALPESGCGKGVV